MTEPLRTSALEASGKTTVGLIGKKKKETLHVQHTFFFSIALLGTPLVMYNINLQYNAHKKKEKKRKKEAKTQYG